ncbi:MAG: IS21 family transposase [Bacteroidota bacterium]
MRKTREILRLCWSHGRSVREASRSLGVSVGVVSKSTSRAKCAGLTWAAVEALSDEELERRLYGEKPVPRVPRPEPDMHAIHVGLRGVGVTLELLHLDYLEEHPTGYRYTAFCDRYRRWLKKRGLVMRQNHKAGAKLFVDYSGKKPLLTDRETGEVREVELFVATLGASSLTYAEATLTQQLPDWIEAHINALRWFGGAAEMLVPDQLRSAVCDPDRHEPVIQRTYRDLARHYGCAVVPARPGRARDKAKVEVAVQVAQRWIVRQLRRETFFEMAAMNARILELLEALNGNPMRHFGGLSRRELFERVERRALQPLPAQRFVYSEWCEVRVRNDYHVNVGGHFYSVPYALAFEVVEARVSASVVEVFHRGRRVAAHALSDVPGGTTTDPAHMLPRHRSWAERDEGALRDWARSVGTFAELMMDRLLTSNPCREQAWRSAWGMRRLSDDYPAERIEAASEQAVCFGARSYRPLARILKLGRDRLPLLETSEDTSPNGIDHENVRGPAYYH